MMSINPDADSTDEIALTHWGVEMARKGGVPKARVLNCLDPDQFTAWLEARRHCEARGAEAIQSRSGRPGLHAAKLDSGQLPDIGERPDLQT
jgi:hypothetical protein